MPDQVERTVRRTGAASAGYSASAAPAAPTPASGAPATMLTEACTPADDGMAMASTYSGLDMCKWQCGRHVQPGLTKGMNKFDTCCRKCGMRKQYGPHSDHDANCQGGKNRRST